MRRRAAWLLLAVLPALLLAQGRRFGRGITIEPNVAYDGRFTFVRLRYADGLDFSAGGVARGNPGWIHDYPAGERNFSRILAELSAVRTRTDGSNILTLDDPELFRFPVAYMSEPGFWRPSEAEVAGLRAYLLKGGFVIFDDFEGRHILNLEAQMRRVLPGMRLIKLDFTHPIFDAFYRIKVLETRHPYTGAPSQYYGIFEDNDPAKRMLAIANHDNDIGDYWEWSADGFFPIDLSNEAYKLGVNYVVYALTR